MIYASADLHIEKSLRNNHSKLKEDGYTALLNFRDAVLNDDTVEDKYVLLAGDVFNKNLVSGDSLSKFSGFVDVLWEHNIPVYFVSGNHDGDSNTHILETQGVIPLGNRVVKIDGRMVAGLDYSPTAVLQAHLKALPKTAEILIMHAPFAHLLNFEGAWQAKMEDIPKHIKTVIAGDIHTTDIRKFGEDQLFISPGALHPCAVDQYHKHGFVKLSRFAGLNDWEFVEIPSRPIFRYVIESEEDSIQLKADLNNMLKQQYPYTPVIEVKYPTSVAAGIHALETRMEKDFIFLMKPHIYGKVLENRQFFKDTKDLKKFSLLEALPFLVSAKDDPELYDLLEELLTSKDPGGYIKKFLDDIKHRYETEKVKPS